MKKCRGCDETKPLSSFRIRTDIVRKNGGIVYRELCLPCERVHQLKRYHLLSPIQKKDRQRRSKENLGPDYYKSYKLKKIGLTLDEFKKMHQNQNGKCYICRVEITGREIKVDHDHTTGIIRKLLCHNCNIALGLLKDNTKLCIRCAEYLEEHAHLHKNSI